jgi:RNA polymerase sigma-70 factor (ECF subfamily)
MVCYIIGMNVTVLYLIFLLALHNNREQDSKELLLSIKRGDHQAFKQFFEKHHTYLYRFLLKRGMSEQQAEDLIQQAFVKIWEQRTEIDETKSLRSYLFRIAYTRMLNQIRDNKKFNDDADPDSKAAQSQTDATLEQQELSNAIERAIQEMPEKRQLVFQLCYLQEFRYQEAAEFMEVSVKTIENHMGAALKDLRSKLEKFR